MVFARRVMLAAACASLLVATPAKSAWHCYTDWLGKQQCYSSYFKMLKAQAEDTLAAGVATVVALTVLYVAARVYSSSWLNWPSNWVYEYGRPTTTVYHHITPAPTVHYYQPTPPPQTTVYHYDAPQETVYHYDAPQEVVYHH